MSDDWAGKILGDYAVDKVFEGASIDVLLEGTQRGLGRKVLIRLLPQSAKDVENRVMQLASLSHPNILPILSFGMHDDRPYTVTELVRGETLQKKLDDRSHSVFRGKTLFPILDVIGWVRTIAAAMDYAHKKGVLHNAIDAANIFIDENDRPFITGFATGVTPSGPLPGTMAPELGKGSAADERADIFSLGCLMYELLVGKPAFEGPTSGETPPSPSGLVPTIPLLLDQIVMKALEQNKKNRYASMAELLGVLDQFASGKLQARLDPQSRMSERGVKGEGGPMKPGKKSGLLILGVILLIIVCAAGLLVGKPWLEKKLSVDRKKMENFCQSQWQLGQNYQANDLKELAAAAYHKIIDQYPRHALAKRAREELKKLDAVS